MAKRTRGACSLHECTDPHYAQTYCIRHYRRFQKYGDPNAGGPLLRKSRRLSHAATFAERFWAKVVKTGSCWLWTGGLDANGYGVVQDHAKFTRAHRVAWVLAGERLVEDMTLDHLCRVRHCVRQDHLEQVTRADNTLRGISPPALNAYKTECKRGHPFDPANTYVGPTGGRICRKCTAIHQAAYRARKAAARL